MIVHTCFQKIITEFFRIHIQLNRLQLMRLKKDLKWIYSLKISFMFRY